MESIGNQIIPPTPTHATQPPPTPPATPHLSPPVPNKHTHTNALKPFHFCHSVISKGLKSTPSPPIYVVGEMIII